MASIRMTIATVTTDKPAGVVPGGWMKKLLQSGVEVRPVQISEDKVAEFLNVPAGEYELYVARVDGNNNVLGSAVTQAITVPANVQGAEQMEVAGSIGVEFF